MTDRPTPSRLDVALWIWLLTFIILVLALAVTFVLEQVDPTHITTSDHVAPTRGVPRAAAVWPVAEAAPPPTTTPAIAAVVVTEPAVRGVQQQVAPTLPPPPTVPSGLWGRPFAPTELDGCAEMEFYREQWGLPIEFDRVGWHESRCRNDVSSYCCHGYWQLYVSLHLRDHRLGPRYAECGITSIDDVLGNDPMQKQRNACGALAVFEISGGPAWDTWGWQ